MTEKVLKPNCKMDTVVSWQMMVAIINLCDDLNAEPYYSIRKNKKTVIRVNVRDEDMDSITSFYPPYRPSEFLIWLKRYHHNNGYIDGKREIQSGMKKLLDLKNDTVS